MKNILSIIVGLFLLVATFYLGQQSVNRQSSQEPIAEVSEATEVSKKEEKVATQSPQSPQVKSPINVIGMEEAMISLFESASKSVCFINTSRIRRDYWRRDVSEIPLGSGSGFIWDKKGHVITNYHVVEKSDKATVTLADQKVYEATIVGVAPEKDLAVLKIDAPTSDLRPIPLGESHSLKVGQLALAIGNPFGLDQTLTTGVVSALGREIQSLTGRPIRDVIQTDAAINPGNSGGPLLDSKGRLIGVNTQIYSPSGASAGIGFSIPVDEVRWVVPDLIAYGEIKRPVLGVSILPAQYASHLGIEGLMIADVLPKGPAEKAGLLPTKQQMDGNIVYGDIITKVGSQSVLTYIDLVLGLEKYEPGEVVTLTVRRDGELTTIDVTLGAS